MGRDWIDINTILDILKKHSLNDKEVEVVFSFLVKYFLEMDGSGKKVRPIKEFCSLYKEN
ncbi:MAG: hypothetical protein QXL85_05165 [Candidatus Bathyarchaeia archaeon]